MTKIKNKFYVSLKYSITKTIELFFAGGVVVTNKLRVKINKAAKRKEPVLRRRLPDKIKELKKDLNQLESTNYSNVS